jgi:peptide/nickel transport system substrate-binding protein
VTHGPRARLTALALAALVLAACSNTSHGAPSAAPSSAEPAVRQGGSVTVALDQEPATFNPRTTRGNTTATRDVVRSVLPSVWTINDKFEFVLNTDVVLSADVIVANPQTIVYRINPRAVWWDGKPESESVPVSADDFVIAYEMARPGATDVGGLTMGIAPNEDLIASVTGSDGGSTVTVVLSQPFADWKALFLTPLVPARQARTVGWRMGFDNGAVWSAGPFRIATYNQGRDLTLVRNERYWATPAKLDSVVFRFLSQSTDTVAELRSGGVGLITPRIQVDLRSQLAQIPGIRWETAPSQVYEYLDFKVTKGFLMNRDVRQAFALALDRRTIVARTVGQLDPSAKVLNNRLYLTSQKEYLDTSGGRYDDQHLGEARQILEGAGFTKGRDGIYAKGDDRLSFSLTTTSGDALREAQEQLIQAQAKEAGIEVKIDNVAPANLSERLLDDKNPFDIANVGQTLLLVSGTSTVFGTDSKINVTKYSNTKVDELFRQARAELDPGKRTGIYYDIDRILWDDMPRLPLYQRPNVVAYRDDLVNVAPSPALGTFWNLERWGLKAK